jgi:hypothetical protein
MHPVTGAATGMSGMATATGSVKRPCPVLVGSKALVLRPARGPLLMRKPNVDLRQAADDDTGYHFCRSNRYIASTGFLMPIA